LAIAGAASLVFRQERDEMTPRTEEAGHHCANGCVPARQDRGKRSAGSERPSQRGPHLACFRAGPLLLGLGTAETGYKLAINLNPNYAMAHHWYAWHLLVLEQNAEGMLEMKKAESLDPLSLIIRSDVANARTASHRHRMITRAPPRAMLHRKSHERDQRQETRSR
jgi:hypothetical protein